MRKLDLEMKRTDALLYQMIPKSVADRLRRGEPSVATCQVCCMCLGDVCAVDNILGVLCVVFVSIRECSKQRDWYVMCILKTLMSQGYICHYL